MSRPPREDGQAQAIGIAHNAVVGELLKLMVLSITAAGGDEADVMVVTESLCLGALLWSAGQGDPTPRVNTFCASLRSRMAELRLGGPLADLPAAGHA